MRGFLARSINVGNISGVSSAPWRHLTATLESDRHRKSFNNSDNNFIMLNLMS